MKHIGDKIKHKNGATMTIVAYRRSIDIDVLFEFENGKEYLAEHKQVAQFTPTMKYPSRYDHIGRTAINKFSGKKMEIIDYRAYHDITVKFEGGGVNEHASIEGFNKGQVKDPALTPKEVRSTLLKGKPKETVRERQSQKYIGKKTTCKNGLVAEIIAWRTARDFDIVFEDGVVVEHVALDGFKSGAIRHPNIRVKTKMTTPKTERVGETRQHKKTGMMMTIIRYGGAHDIDIKFEDGAVVEHKVYTNFKRGIIQYPDERSRLEEIIYAPRVGLSMKIINYRAARDVDIQYEDGTIIRSINYKTLRKSPPKHPVLDYPKGKLFNNFELFGLAFKTTDAPYYYCKHINTDDTSFDVMTPKEMLKFN